MPFLHRWVHFFVLLLCCVTVASCGREASSSPFQIVGADDRDPLHENHPLQRAVGALLFSGKPVCTAFAIGPRKVMTANHCFKESQQGNHTFRSALGEFDVRGSFTRHAHLDLVELELQNIIDMPAVKIDGKSTRELQERQEYFSEKRRRSIFTEYLTLDSSVNWQRGSGDFFVVSHDRVEGQLLTHRLSKPVFERATQDLDGFFFHELDTVSGASGSPILQGNKVVGIHLGGTLSSERNFAVRTHTLFEDIVGGEESRFNIADHIYVGECAEATVEKGPAIFDQNGNPLPNPQVKYDVTGCVDELLSLVLDFVPGVSNVKSLIEGIVGMDIVTWENLSPAEQAATLAAVASGPLAKVGAKSVRLSMLVADVAKTAKKIGMTRPDDLDILAKTASKLSQRQGRHIKGHRDYGGKGYLDNLEDAKTVLKDYKSGNVQFLGRTNEGHVIIRHPTVRGTNVNTAAGFPAQSTDVFYVKGTAKPSVVPYNPNWKAK